MTASVKSHESSIAALQKLKSLGFTSYKEARANYKIKMEKDGSVTLIEKNKK